ncbi:MAG: toll/interleukin-1 receptor domain-containing protein [Chloroflexi bacterium]|nr:toll/interleukin-1 receptor domain-containing protein [Chloroflexota bacterium]
MGTSIYEWDAFICHASEDKEDFVRPLANRLNEHVRVWYDEFSLKIGDSLRQSIDHGISSSRFGIVILSPRFFEKGWTQEELDGLMTMQTHGRTTILPVWLDVGYKEVEKYSPILAGKVAARAADGLDAVVSQLLRVLLPETENMDELLFHRMEEGERLSAPPALTDLDDWVSDCMNRWHVLRSEHSLPDDAERFDKGTWSAAYAIAGERTVPNLSQMMRSLRETEGNETGWPVWWVPPREDFAPYPHEGRIECWLGEPQGIFTDGAHSDFWRADPQGKLFLIRGYQEDGPREATNQVPPGKFLDLVLPVWQVGECVLHAARMASNLSGNSWRVVFRFDWSGLRGRTIQAWATRRILFEDRIAKQDHVTSNLLVTADQFNSSLTDIVQSIVAPLYEVFDFFDPPRTMIREELTQLVERGADEINI